MSARTNPHPWQKQKQGKKEIAILDARLTLSTRGRVYYPKPTYNATINAVYSGTSLAGENPLALDSTQLVNLVSRNCPRHQTNARHIKAALNVKRIFLPHIITK